MAIVNYPNKQDSATVSIMEPSSCYPNYNVVIPSTQTRAPSILDTSSSRLLHSGSQISTRTEDESLIVVEPRRCLIDSFGTDSNLRLLEELEDIEHTLQNPQPEDPESDLLGLDMINETLDNTGPDASTAPLLSTRIVSHY